MQYVIKTHHRSSINVTKVGECYSAINRLPKLIIEKDVFLFSLFGRNRVYSYFLMLLFTIPAYIRNWEQRFYINLFLIMSKIRVFVHPPFIFSLLRINIWSRQSRFPVVYIWLIWLEVQSNFFWSFHKGFVSYVSQLFPTVC